LDELPDPLGDVAGGGHTEKLTVESEDQRSLPPTEPDGVLDYRFEHGLQVEGGAADHLEDFAGSRLPLQRFRQLAAARLQLLEQPNVLEGDHRLIGEDLEERDLRVREWLDLHPADDDCPDGDALAQQRSA